MGILYRPVFVIRASAKQSRKFNCIIWKCCSKGVEGPIRLCQKQGFSVTESSQFCRVHPQGAQSRAKVEYMEFDRF